MKPSMHRKGMKLRQRSETMEILFISQATVQADWAELICMKANVCRMENLVPQKISDRKSIRMPMRISQAFRPMEKHYSSVRKATRAWAATTFSNRTGM